MKAYYTGSEAAEITGASSQILRVYTQKFAEYFSPTATPPKGEARNYTVEDLKLIAFVYDFTSRKQTYADVREALAAGELDQFAWKLPESTEQPTETAESASEPYTGALVPVERLQALDTLRQSAEQREAEALARLQEAEQQIRDLERQLGEAAGQLAGYKARQYRAPGWWRAIFGGEAAE